MRTDLAYESEQEAKASGSLEGIAKRERSFADSELEVTEIDVLTDAAAGQLGKPKGKYITLRSTDGRFSDLCGLLPKRAKRLAEELLRLEDIPERVLVAGLGNLAITPDSLGPRTAALIPATRHIKRLARDIDTSSLAEVTVISAGVMAQTGIESQSLIKAVCEKVSPQLVIVVDALACSELSHLGSTIQLCDTGISPGSGVENARKELSKATLGIPTVAIGVPTVTDCATIAEYSGGDPDTAYSGMIVTPRDIDLLTERTASLIADAVNRVLHPTADKAILDALR